MYYKFPSASYISPDYRMTYDWINCVEQERKDSTWFKQLIKDGVSELKQHRDFYCFTLEQVQRIQSITVKRYGIETEFIIIEEMYLIKRRN